MPIDAQLSRAVFQKLENDLIKLSSKPQAKSVHRFRTGTRRVQILLGELSPRLDGSDKKLLKSLNRIRKRAGKLRDLDVQLTALRSLKVQREPRRKTQLVNHLIELRTGQEKKLRKSVDDATVREIRRRLRRAEKRFDPRAAHDPLAAARAMLERFDDAAPITEAALHQYRILSKRARYAAEFVSPASLAAPLIAEIKRFQDALGDWHDWLTLAQTAGDQLGEMHESVLVAELRNVTGAKYRRALAAVSQMRAKIATNGKPATPAPAREVGSAIGKKISAA
jgi:CHAD domain-containing protein